MIGDIDLQLAIMNQISEICKGIRIQETMCMIHEYGLDDLCTSYFDDENKQHNTRLGEFRSILRDEYTEEPTFSGENKVTGFCGSISREKKNGESNSPWREIEDCDPKLYTPDEQVARKISDTLDDMNYTLSSIISNCESVSCRYDYVNNRYLSIIKKEDPMIPVPMLLKFVVDVDDNRDMFIYDMNEDRIKLDEENKEEVNSLIEEFATNSMTKEVNFDDIREKSNINI